MARQAILRLQLEIAEDSADPAEIIHGFERFELWIIRGRERLADVDTKDTWSDSHLDTATNPLASLGCFGIVLQRFLL